MIKILLLTITIILSVLSIISYEIYPEEPYNKSYDFLKVIGPGIFYSFFLISFLKTNFNKLILKYLILVGMWILLFFLTYASWGVVTPVSGAASGIIIGRIIFGLDENYSLKRDPYLWMGGLSATAGWLIFFYANSNNENTWGFNLMWIIICWQLAIGLLIIRTADKP